MPSQTFGPAVQKTWIMTSSQAAGHVVDSVRSIRKSFCLWGVISWLKRVITAGKRPTETFPKRFAEILYVVKTQPDERNSRFSTGTILCHWKHASLEHANPNTDTRCNLNTNHRSLAIIQTHAMIIEAWFCHEPKKIFQRQSNTKNLVFLTLDLAILTSYLVIQTLNRTNLTLHLTIWLYI